MNFLFKPLLAIPLAFLAMTACSASEQTTVSLNPNATKPGIHLVLNGGYTYGGDTVATVNFANGDASNLKGGALYQIGIGGLYQFESQPVALRLSANFHYDLVSTRNGGVFFYRFPIESLAYYTGIEKFRIGGGARVINSPEVSTTINGVTDRITYNNTTGIVAEVGYQLAPRAWLNFRLVSEKYQGKEQTANGITTSLAGMPARSGSHIGVNFSFEP